MPAETLPQQLNTVEQGPQGGSAISPELAAYYKQYGEEGQDNAILTELSSKVATPNEESQTSTSNADGQPAAELTDEKRAQAYGNEGVVNGYVDIVENVVANGGIPELRITINGNGAPTEEDLNKIAAHKVALEKKGYVVGDVQFDKGQGVAVASIKRPEAQKATAPAEPPPPITPDTATAAPQEAQPNPTAQALETIARQIRNLTPEQQALLNANASDERLSRITMYKQQLEQGLQLKPEDLARLQESLLRLSELKVTSPESATPNSEAKGQSPEAEDAVYYRSVAMGMNADDKDPYFASMPDTTKKLIRDLQGNPSMSITPEQTLLLQTSIDRADDLQYDAEENRAFVRGKYQEMLKTGKLDPEAFLEDDKNAKALFQEFKRNAEMQKEFYRCEADILKARNDLRQEQNRAKDLSYAEWRRRFRTVATVFSLPAMLGVAFLGVNKFN